LDGLGEQYKVVDVDAQPHVIEFLRKRLNGQFFVPVLHDSVSGQILAGWSKEGVEKFLG